MTEIKGPDVDDFCIIKPISRGAFGKVFLGYKKNHPENIYAIKVLSKSDIVHRNMASQVIRERNALALSKSPFCVQLFYCLQNATNIYMVMEYVIGGDLKSLLSECGYFDENMAVFYTAEITLALEYLHTHGIVHRDVKPDNMLLTDKGHIKLTDFGLSRVHIARDLKISDLLLATPSVSKTGHHVTRTPGQLLSLTSHLSFDNGYSPTDRGQSPILNSPEIARDKAFADHSFCGLDNEELHIEDSPIKSSPERTTLNVNIKPVLKRKFINTEEKENSNFKVPRTGLTGIFRFANLKDDSASELEDGPKAKSRSFSPPKSKLDYTPVSQSSKFHPQTCPIPFNSPPPSGSSQQDRETPFRTPRFTKRGRRRVGVVTFSSPEMKDRNLSDKDGCVLGTPDYLAPELLLKHPHGEAVDWWSLGVCLYEFLLGIPPFNGDTPQEIFSNILERNIEWPPEDDDCLRSEAKEVIEALLTLEPQQRANGSSLRNLALFRNICWQDILNSRAPFIPQPKDHLDTTYFQARNCLQNLCVSQIDL